MERYIAEMPSYTYALKAEKLLKSRGIRCEIKRRSENCGYDVYVFNKTSLDIMKKSGIPYTLKNMEGG